MLDVRISVKLAFFALVEHELTYAPLWNEGQHNHVGMLTSTDLIQILEYGYAHNCVPQVRDSEKGEREKGRKERVYVQFSQHNV